MGNLLPTRFKSFRLPENQKTAWARMPTLPRLFQQFFNLALQLIPFRFAQILFGDFAVFIDQKSHR
ncbi:MAG: hypothetical protein J5680_05700, partial [Neisseriaceae bacterium]|nr:hypothetical protein [Neisseriaceae bacterium]